MRKFIINLNDKPKTQKELLTKFRYLKRIKDNKK